MARVMNFGGGPGALPRCVLEQVAAELPDFASTGMSILEHSHRGTAFERVFEETRALIRELLALPDTHEVLLLQGGASMQFAMVPLNFLARGAVGAYVVGGAWGEKAFEEGGRVAAILGASTQVLATSKANADYVEPVYTYDAPLGNTAYVHLTSNETIHGIEYDKPEGVPLPLPSDSNVPVVCDMSSNFLARPQDLSRISLAYAGAQKNIGPSGLVVVVAQKQFIDAAATRAPNALSYAVQAKSGSMYNTPPTLAVEITRRVLLWLREQGGVAGIGAVNHRKARTLYRAIDESKGFYRCPVATAARSEMNAVFRLPTPALEQLFLSDAAREQMVGLAGHRSVGGIRVSMYNAVSELWVSELTRFMDAFAARHG
jgi:phosphoserine aminotransferase